MYRQLKFPTLTAGRQLTRVERLWGHRLLVSSLVVASVCGAWLPGSSVSAQKAPAAAAAPASPSRPAAAENSAVADDYQQAVNRAIEFLRSRGQAPDGSFSKGAGPGITALVTTAVLRHGRTVDDPLVSKALEYVTSFAQPDGGIHAPESLYGNYETCLALMCLQEANADGRYNEQIARGRAYLKNIQWDEGEGKGRSDFAYGGAGYGSHKRPDLSNTTFFIDTLRATGSESDDEAIQRALVFVSRCQNFESEHNTTAWATKNPDGGFYYTSAAGGSSQAGTTEAGGLRSYGSMTYAGLKSMIYAGVTPDDSRVQAALSWIRNNYTLETNPGMGDSGLYYYYHTFSKTLHTLQEQALVDQSGTSHDWRAELTAELLSRQQANGSWVNATERWMEGDPNLATGYALLALAYCRPVVAPANQ